jgi:hypothetical protein
VSKRERTLAIVVLCLLGLVAANYTKSRCDRMVAARRSALLSAKERLADAQFALANGRRAVAQMEDWQARSLPPDRGVATSLYRSWLLEKLKSAGLSVDDVNPDLRSGQTAAYGSIGYLVEARGSLESIAALLYEFYRSPLLQQITRMRLRPNTDDAGLIDVSLRVEALMLPGAMHTDKLPEGTSDRLALAGLDDYRRALSERNVFAAYVPPAAERPAAVAKSTRPAPQFDAAGHAYVTGIVETDGKLQAWITVRTTGEVLRLVEGDPLKVGLLEGRIVSIGPRELVLEAGGKQLKVELGHSLREEAVKETGGQGDKETS